MREFRGYIMILVAAVFWGLSATAAKGLLNQNVETVLIVQTRVTFSCLILLASYLAFRPALLRIKVGDLPRFALLGIIGVAGSNFTYYFTIRESTVGTAILIQYTAPLLVVVYAAVTKEEKFTAAKLVASLVSLFGCFLAVGAYDSGVLRITPIGIVTGIGSVFSFAFLNVYTRHMLTRYGFWTVVFYSLVCASLLWIVINPPWSIVGAHVDGRTWLTLLLFAIVSVLIPHTLYFGGLRFIVASRAIITSTLEPIVAIVSAAVLLAEYLHPVQMLGAVLVIAAIVLLQLKAEPATVSPRRVVVPEQANAT